MPDDLTPEDPGQALIARLAARVSAARKARGLPRRALSELSGVSPRYLAQLEAGQGNISVLLLARVAAALDLRVEQLLGDDQGTFDAEVMRVARLYDAAPADVQGEVRQLLAPQNPAALRAGRIGLIGLRGAGKSTLGQMAGEALGIPFIELGREIEAETEMPLNEVIALYGIEGYRRLEAEALDRVCAAHEQVILAVAGGIVAETETYQKLLQRFHTIWIRTSPPEHMQRVRAQGDHRPMQGNPAAMKQLKALLDTRTPLYEQAEAQVDTSNRTERSALNTLLDVIAQHGFLDNA